MDWLKLKTGGTKLFHKYKFVLLIIILGIALMTLPGKSEEVSISPESFTPAETVDTEDKLKTILRQVRGAGRVEVMLTVASGQETIYQSDTDQSIDENRQTNRSETVIVTGADRAQSGLITQTNPPLYLGAIVVCDGGDDPVVCLQIVEAVSKATGLGADKISVLKMK